MLKQWHIKKLEKLQQMTGLTAYQILWIAFFEGLFFGIIIGWWLF